MTADVQLPPIPPSEDREAFWRAYLLANQIILYLGARPPAEAEAFSSVLQIGTVEPDSEIGRGRAALVKVTEKVVESMSSLPADSSLRGEYPEVLEAFEKVDFLLQEYRISTGEETQMEKWSRFYTGLRSDLVQFTLKLTSFIEREEAQQQK
ncbi:hypothetical protein V5O48_010500 [Marasmius crinis-equi]|uniref:Uncharacterized protein n=1 Tax=Marasmius crinis-equi TaxID=585013 RepID=A0ABR3F866_9AGAR